ncbi:MAG: hypothetical protein ABII27_03025 [bacterium]
MKIKSRFNSVLKLIFSVSMIIVFYSQAFAGDSGRIQLSIPSPDPTLAGEKMTFQVIAVNTGTEKWLKKQYFIEVEIYDVNKGYVLKSNPLRGGVDVNPSSNILAYLPVVIPNYFAGLYYYKVFLTHNKARLAHTDYIPFNVNPLPISPPKIPKFKVGGNMAVSYESNDSNDWNDYTANVSLNLIGRVMDRSFLFNMYTISDQNDGLDIYTILFSFYGTNTTINAGDIQPEFSTLSLYGAGMKGAELLYNYGKFTTDIISARITDSEEGSGETDGIYRRMLYGVRQGMDLPFNINAGVNYVRSEDAESSLDVTGPTLTPEENSVAGGDVTFQLMQGVKLKGDFQSSKYFANTKSTNSALSDSAYRVNLEIEYPRVLINTYFENINPEFYAFGVPDADNDRQTYDAYGESDLFDFLNLSLGFNQYHNNLENTEEYTTTQKTSNGGLVFTFPWNGGASVNYSKSEAFADDSTLLDNSSLSMTYGANQSFLGQSVSAYLQSTEFEDMTDSSDDLETQTIGTTLNLNFKDIVTASLGVSLTEITDIVQNTVEDTNSFSVSLSYIVLKDKLSSQLWGYLTTDADDTETINTSEQKINLEFTYQLNPQTAVTLGGGQLDYKDEIEPLNDKDEVSANIRVSYSF